MKLIYSEINDNVLIGYYPEDMYSKDLCNNIIKSGGICIDEELWQYCVSLGSVKFMENVEARTYTIEDKEKFLQYKLPINSDPKPPILEERITALENLLMEVL